MQIPSIAGKTLGDNENDFLEVRIRTTRTSAFVLDLACIQIDATGFGAGSYRLRSTADELARCVPYFQRLCGETNVTLGLGQARSATAARVPILFMAPMHKVPNMSISSAGHFRLIDETGGSALVITSLALTSTGRTNHRGELQVGVASGLAAGNATQLVSANAGAHLDLSAEL
jgi:hypothetical protein